MSKHLVAALHIILSDYENAEKWIRTSNPRFRSKIKKNEDNIEEVLKYLADTTEVKESTGQKSYLLYRGMGPEEFLRHYKPKNKVELDEYGADWLGDNVVESSKPVKYRRNSSWTTDKDVAAGFAKDRWSGITGFLVSAFILESAIVYGIIDSPLASFEKEIIVGKGLITSDYTYQSG